MYPSMFPCVSIYVSIYVSLSSPPSSGSSSVIIRGDGVLRSKSEVDEIHQENLTRLSSMSHEERMKEREELLSCLSEDQIAFLRSLRSGGGKAARGGSEVEQGVVAMEVEGERKAEEERLKEKKEKSNNDVDMKEETEGGESHTAPQEGKTVRFKDVEMDETKTKEPSEETPMPAELPISQEEARKWLHMDKVGNGELYYI